MQLTKLAGALLAVLVLTGSAAALPANAPAQARSPVQSTPPAAWSNSGSIPKAPITSPSFPKRESDTSFTAPLAGDLP